MSVDSYLRKDLIGCGDAHSNKYPQYLQPDRHQPLRFPKSTKFLKVEKTEPLLKKKKISSISVPDFICLSLKYGYEWTLKNDQCRHTFWCGDLDICKSHGLEIW